MRVLFQNSTELVQLWRNQQNPRFTEKYVRKCT